MKGIIFVDVKKCLSCKSCEMECVVVHSESGSLLKAIQEEPLPQSRIMVEKAGDFSIPMQCRHCEDAPCVAVCPTKATVKLGDGEPVIVKDELCIGCKLCILVCPFGVLKMNREGKVIIKCDLCIERLKKGEKPACVVACPTGALKFKSIEEATKELRGKTAVDYLVKLEPKKKGVK